MTIEKITCNQEFAIILNNNIEDKILIGLYLRHSGEYSKLLYSAKINKDKMNGSGKISCIFSDNQLIITFINNYVIRLQSNKTVDINYGNNTIKHEIDFTVELTNEELEELLL